jgi:hypothetical protein
VKTKNCKKQKTKRTKGEVEVESSTPSAVKWSDFAARGKKTIGNRVLPGSALVLQARGRF